MPTAGKLFGYIIFAVLVVTTITVLPAAFDQMTSFTSSDTMRWGIYIILIAAVFIVPVFGMIREIR